MLKKLGGEGRVEKKRAFFRSQKMKDYHRLHSWIESRIGPLTKQEDPQQLHPRLLKLMEEEEYVWGIRAIAAWKPASRPMLTGNCWERELSLGKKNSASRYPFFHLVLLFHPHHRLEPLVKQVEREEQEGVAEEKFLVLIADDLVAHEL